MPIDKIIPRFLVSDEDERLLKEGAMTDALNVTISENGDGTEGVIKNVRGTIACTPDDGSELSDNEPLVVIGTVSDDQQGYIYFFVAEDSVTTEESAIYRLDTSDNTYEKVFKGRKLNFSASSFVKAEVINIEPPGRNLESILYFTDNINPPRKINVNRAIAGDYDALTQEELDYAINCVKAAPTSPPSFTFETDSNIHTNDLKENLFQFAFQIVYTDGEESAIGPYSKLAVPRPSVYGGLESAGYGIVDYIDNVCLINTNISKDLPDLKRVRLLARRGNDGAFFLVDEFDPKEDLTREIGNGIATTIYSSDSQKYRFYNDKLGPPVDTTLVDKLYDNVPQKAEGLAIVDNRLMFSNYIEGRENVDLGSTTLDVEYSNVGSTSDNLIRSNEYTTVVTQAGTINIEFDCEDAATISSGTIIQAGTRVLIEFTFKPTFTAAANGGLISIDAVQEDQQGNTVASGTLTANSLTFGTLDTDTEKFVLDVRTPVDFTTTNFASYIQGLVESESVKLTYSVTSGSLTGNGGISSTSIDDATIEVTFKFGETTNSSNSTVVFEPRITRMRLTEMTYDNSLIESAPQADIFVPDGDAQSEVTYSSVSATYISDQVALVQEADVRKTFKAGASHNFGVVFYDKYNRSGFVNEIGSVFVDHVATRAAKYGPANVKIRKAWTDPTWAESYQIVYGGSSVQDVTQYTVGNAFAEREGQSHNINPDSKRLYVSLKTLEIYRDDKEVLRDYSFTKGDKLRIINYTHTDDSKVYPTGQDGDVNGEVIEFDIVGVEILGDTDNPIADSSTVADKFKGTFVVIEAPAIVATSSNTTSADVNKYPDFDWYHVTGNNYNSTVTVSQLNRWVQNVLVELVTPRKTTSERVYYEIGERFSIADSVKDIKVEGGDVYYRPVSCKSVTFDNSWHWDDPTKWEYQAQWLEDHSVSDTFSSRHIDYGRSHAKFEGADANRYLNGITYSEKYVIDSANLPLSSFNARLANFDSTDLRYGALRYIGNYNNDLVAIQENKLSLIPVSKNIIEYAGGESNVAVSTNILGRPRYSTGDYGCGTHPSSVLIRDNDVFFADESRRAVVQLTGGQIVPISEANMSSFFEDFFSDNTCKYVSGYDPRDDIYFITRRDGTVSDRTVGFDASRRKWMSKYSFAPDHYATQNNMLYSAKYVYNASAEDELIWRHEDLDPLTNRNNFYGTDYNSLVEVVSKMSPSRVKVFNAMSYEGSSEDWLGTSSGLTTDLDQFADGITTWSEREGSYYASMPRDRSSNSESQKIYIGDLTLDSGFKYNVTGARLNRLPIPLNVDLTVGGVTRQVTEYTATTITFNNVITTSLSNVELSLPGEGDHLRGHWLKIRLENQNDRNVELYCINTHITDSKSHHPLGG
jgi:hypothetical protein